MNDKTILLECKDCGEVFLGDDLCDGCMCPICGSGMIVIVGIRRNMRINAIEANIKAIEKELEEDKDTIARAKKNGLIRTYNKRKGEDNLIGGVDYSSEDDKTSMSINTTEEDDLELVSKVSEQNLAVIETDELYTKEQVDKLIKEKEEELKSKYNKAIFNLSDELKEKSELLDWSDKQLNKMVDRIERKNRIIRELSELLIELSDNETSI